METADSSETLEISYYVIRRHNPENLNLELRIVSTTFL
jgi:hypothetical protein